MTNPATATRRALAATLAALIAVPFASAQTDAETVRRLQEDNARLRQQLAEFQSRGVTAPAIAPASVPAAPAAQAAAPACWMTALPDYVFTQEDTSRFFNAQQHSRSGSTNSTAKPSSCPTPAKSSFLKRHPNP